MPLPPNGTSVMEVRSRGRLVLLGRAVCAGRMSGGCLERSEMWLTRVVSLDVEFFAGGHAHRFDRCGLVAKEAIASALPYTIDS